MSHHNRLQAQLEQCANEIRPLADTEVQAQGTVRGKHWTSEWYGRAYTAVMLLIFSLASVLGSCQQPRLLPSADLILFVSSHHLSAKLLSKCIVLYDAPVGYSVHQANGLGQNETVQVDPAELVEAEKVVLEGMKEPSGRRGD